MGVLRKTVQREVLDLLDSSIFTVEDFDVVFGDPDNKEYIVVITFRYQEEYTYMISRHEKGKPGVWVDRRPGDFEENDKRYFTTFGDALTGLGDWCSEVRNELKASQPLYTEVDKLREIIEEHINFDKNSDEFSAEDIFILRKKFTDLEERVIKLEKDKIITESQLTEFKTGITQVKDDIEFYPKTTWVKTATNKLAKIVMSIGKSKEGRALLTDGARKLLGFD